METINYKTISEPLSYREMMGVKGGGEGSGCSDPSAGWCCCEGRCVDFYGCDDPVRIELCYAYFGHRTGVQCKPCDR